MATEPKAQRVLCCCSAYNLHRHAVRLRSASYNTANPNNLCGTFTVVLQCCCSALWALLHHRPMRSAIAALPLLTRLVDYTSASWMTRKSERSTIFSRNLYVGKSFQLLCFYYESRFVKLLLLLYGKQVANNLRKVLISKSLISWSSLADG